MKKITALLLFITSTLFISCSSDEDSSPQDPAPTKPEVVDPQDPSPTTPEIDDPRLPNQKLFRPAVKLFPKKENLKSITKITEATISQDALGNEVQNNISEMSFSYDSKGRLNTTDKKSELIDFFTAAKFHYNSSDELINATSSFVTVKINSKGYITQKTDQYGKVLNLYYDEIGRLIKEEGVYPYNQLLLTYSSNGDYETYEGITETKTTYKYVDDKIFVETIENAKDFITIIRTNDGIIKNIKDKITQKTLEITVDYNKAGAYSSDPIFRDNFRNWLHLKEQKVKIVVDGTVRNDSKVDYDYSYDKDGYLTVLTETVTYTNGGKPVIWKTSFTYE